MYFCCECTEIFLEKNDYERCPHCMSHHILTTEEAGLKEGEDYDNDYCNM